MCGAIVLGQLGFLTRGFMIGIALFRIRGPAKFGVLFASRLKTGMPTRAPTDNLLLALRPTMSKNVEIGKYTQPIIWFLKRTSSMA